MTDIKDCCCCGKVYRKPKYRAYSLHSARHQSKCMLESGVFMLFKSRKDASFWVDNWSDSARSVRLKDKHGTWLIVHLLTGYHAVAKGDK